MYQVLYRKYRPSNFNDVVGQTIIVNTLKNAISHEKVSHAYLFSGPRGTGKTSIAKIFAKTINCKNQKNGIPCDKCVCCTQINNKQSTDIIEIDAASNNGVDEIREIRDRVNLVPSTGKYKIYIIDEVHMLTQGAFNALLKTLEEPPKHVIFILATTEPHKIPATILSRCQRFDFKKISNSQIVERLKFIAKQENIDITQEALETIGLISDGGMRDSISLLDQATSYTSSSITVDDIHEVNGSITLEEQINFIENILEKNLEKSLSMIDNYDEKGKNLIKILEEIVNTLKDILLIKLDILKYNSDNRYIKYEEKFKNIDKIRIIDLMNDLNNKIVDIKQANDYKLAIELMIIKECINNFEEKDKRIILKEDTNRIQEIDKSLIVEEKNLNNNMQTNINKDISSIKTSKITDNIKNIRINNTLFGFSKNTTKEIKNTIKNVEEYLLDPNYSNIASLIIDGELKAASDEYLLFVYSSEGAMLKFNEELYDIEKLLLKVLNRKYKVIAIDNISWEIIKKEFNSKSKKYDFIEETFFVQKKEEKVNSNKELSDFFENIIEYE